MKYLSLIIGLLLSSPGLCGYSTGEAMIPAPSRTYGDVLATVSSLQNGCMYEQKLYPIGNIIAFPDEGTAISCVFNKDDRPRWMGIELPGCLNQVDLEC